MSKIFTFFLACAAVPFFASCTKGKQPDRPNGKVEHLQPGAPSSPGGGPSTQQGQDMTAGTTDGGGGNGVNGKIFEAYAVDPLLLPEFKDHLAPILNHLDQQMKNKGAFFINSAKLKTWFIAPLKLRTIPNDFLGLSHSEESSQQLAYQTKREIWIDSQYYSQGQSKDRARLLAHELIMMIYLQKFQSMVTNCNQLKEIGVSTDCQGAKFIDEIIVAEKMEELTPDDYANIRRVTHWLFTDAEKASAQQIQEKFINNGFDRRSFEPNIFQNQEDTPLLPVSGKQIEALIRKAQLLDKMPTNCLFVENSIVKDCQSELTQISNNGSFEMSRLKFSFLDGASAREVDFYSGSAESFASPFGFGDSMKNYYVVGMSPQLNLNPQIGDSANFAAFLLKKSLIGEDVELSIEGLVVFPTVITEIVVKERLSCRVGIPKASGIENDILLLSQEDAPIDYLKWFATHFRITEAPCSFQY